jgi:hypothetical protein
MPCNIFASFVTFDAATSFPAITETDIDFHSLPPLPELDVKSILRSSHLPMLDPDLISTLGCTGLSPAESVTMLLTMTVEEHGKLSGRQRALIEAFQDKEISVPGSKYLTLNEITF